MTIDPTTIGLGLGGGIIAIFLLRFIFGKKKLNAMATEVTKVRDSDHIPEPVEVPPADPSATAPEGAGFTRTLSMRERILLHLRYVTTAEDPSSPPVVQAVAAVVDGCIPGFRTGADPIRFRLFLALFLGHHRSSQRGNSPASGHDGDQPVLRG